MSKKVAAVTPKQIRAWVEEAAVDWGRGIGSKEAAQDYVRRLLDEQLGDAIMRSAGFGKWSNGWELRNNEKVSTAVLAAVDETVKHVASEIKIPKLSAANKRELNANAKEWFADAVRDVAYDNIGTEAQNCAREYLDQTVLEMIGETAKP